MIVLFAVQNTDVVVSAGEGDQDHGRGVEGDISGISGISSCF